MPTGYTMNVSEGQSFESFVWGCAKAFGACVTMRDSDANEPVPQQFEPSDYHSKKAEELAREIRLLNKTSDALLAKTQYADEVACAKTYNEELLKKDKLEKERFASMMARVQAWTPPSKEHEPLKEFMIQQLGLTTKYANDTPYQTPPPPESITEYREKKYAKLVEDLKYHNDEHAKEVARVAQRNAWVVGLRASISQPR